MNKPKLFIKMMCLVLTAFVALGYFSEGLSKVVMAASSTVYTYHLPYWHPSGEYPGGWARHEGDSIYFFEISDMPGKIAYCMEPGRARVDGAAAESVTPEQVFAGGNNVISGDTIKNFTEILLSLGYKGSASALTTSNGVQDPTDNLYYAVATQILLWEVIIGERDSDFNYRNTGNVNLAELVLGPVNESTSPEVRAFHEGEDYWYRLIEGGVRNYLHNRVIPSFAYETADQAAAAVGDARYLVDPSSRSIVLTDANGVLAQYPHLSFTVNGQNVNADYALDTENSRVTIAFNDASIEIDDVLLTLRSDVSSRRFALVYGDGRWGPDWAESDNWQEIATWGDEEFDYVYVRFTDDVGFSVTKVADSGGDVISGIAFNLWRYAEGRNSGFYNAGEGDVIVAAGFTDDRGRLVWETEDSTSLDLPAGNYGINEIYVPTYYRTADEHDIQYPYEIPTDGSRTWYTRGNTMENHMFYTSFALGGSGDVDFVLHNRRSQGGFSLNKSINPLIPGFGFPDMSFFLFYDTDGSGSYTDVDYLVANGICDNSGKVLWTGEGYRDRYRFTDLPSGNYIIRETWNNDTYTISNTGAGWIRIDDHTYDMPLTIVSGSTPNYTVVNRPETGSVEAYKEVINSSSLFNAQSVRFALYRDGNGNGLPETGERIAEGTPTGEEGRVLWTGDTGDRPFAGADRVDLLRYGQYIIEENWAHTSFEVANVSEGWTRLSEGRYIRTFDISSSSRDFTFRVSNEARFAGIDVWKDIPSGDAFDISLVRFDLLDRDGNPVASGTPGSDGHVVWNIDVTSGLPYGRYTLAETWPLQYADCADGSHIPLQAYNETEDWIRIENDDGTITYSVSFDLDSNIVYTFRALNNEHSNSLRVVKIPSQDGDECDIRFELYASGGVLYAQGTAHSSGAAGDESPVIWQGSNGDQDVLQRVPEGSYILREYIPSTYYADTMGEDTGIAYTYDVPEGFSLSDDGTYFYRTVSIRDGQNDTYTVRAVNVRQEGSLEILKESETGIVEGLMFSVSYRGDAEEFNAGTAPCVQIGTFETDEQGRIVLDKLPGGWYEISETVPSHMICRWDDGSVGAFRRVWVDASESARITVTATNLINAIIRVNKVDEWTGEAVGGAEFDLYTDINSNGVIDEDELDTAVHMRDSDGDGVVYFPGIRSGSYIIKEVVTAEGYLLNESLFPVRIMQPEIFDVTVEETPVTMNIRLYKVDENDALHFLSGAQFELYADSNGNGEFDPEDTIAASYADGGYIPVNVILTEDSEGVPMYVLDREVRAGTYFLIETRPPEGFAVNEDNCFKIVLGGDPGTSSPELSYYLGNGLHGGIRLFKVDEDHPENRLSGAVFTVFADGDGNGIYTEGVDEQCGVMQEVRVGEYLITDLPYGKFFIIETESPDGFIRRSDVWEIMVTSDSVIYEISDHDFPGIYNVPEGSVTVFKHDEDYPEVLLSGAEFTVRSASDDSLIGVLSEDDGVYTLTGLDAGDYYLVETTAPEGFVRDTNIYPFTIGRESRDITIDNTANAGRPVEGAFVNRPVRASVRIHKIVPEGTSPEGFVFEIVRDGEVIHTVTTGPDGTVTLEDLRFGTYTIREIECETTRGRFRLASPLTLTINGTNEIDGTVIDVDIVNLPYPTPKVTDTPAPPVPDTGESLISAARICGIFSVVIGTVVLIKIRRKEGRDA